MPRTRDEIRAALDVLADALADVLTSTHPTTSSTLGPTRETAKPLSDWLTVAEAAAYVHVSKGLIYGEARCGRLRAVRVGRLLRFHREWLDEWLTASARFTK
jgi:excisionase family DNA binding protein